MFYLFKIQFDYQIQHSANEECLKLLKILIRKHFISVDKKSNEKKSIQSERTAKKSSRGHDKVAAKSAKNILPPTVQQAQQQEERLPAIHDVTKLPPIT